MNKLYLVGESHFDPDGHKRLERLLAVLQPAVLAIEDTESDFRTEQRNAQKPNAIQLGVDFWLQNFPQANRQTILQLVQNVIHKILLFGQYQQRGDLLFCDNPEIVDSEEFESATSRGLKKSLELETLAGMSPTQLRLAVAQDYAKVKYPVADSPNLVSFYSARDAFAEGKLRRQALQREDSILYFCGLDHLYGSYNPNLFKRLADLKPKRLKLNVADKLKP